jgi:hypothetical protein
MTGRAKLITALLAGIVSLTAVGVLQGKGDELLEPLLGVVAFALLGAAVMLYWTARLMFWGTLWDWIRGRDR